MMLVEEYVKKVETFLELWREEMISGIELVECIEGLSRDVVYIRDNNVIVPTSQFRHRAPRD